MTDQPTSWIDQIREQNAVFQRRVDPHKLPVGRTPGSVAVITCMDPRVNLEALGIPGFSSAGEGISSVRVIRTIGAMAEERSLIVGLFLAGIREVAVVMHTDCGCCLAYSKIDAIVENMRKRLTADQFEGYRAEVGEPFTENLRARLKAFADPREAVQREVASIRALPYIPPDLIVHGLVYELESGRIEVVVDGTTR